MKEYSGIGGKENRFPTKDNNFARDYNLNGKGINFEKLLKEYFKEGKGKLDKDLKGTREAIRQLANEKVKEFMAVNDLGLNMEERRYLAAAIIASMYQSFCYGYSIGRVEGETSEKIML